MDFNGNLLSSDPAKYLAQNATVTGAKITLNANAKVSQTLTKDTVGFTPEYFKLLVRFKTTEVFTSMEPKAFVRLTVKYVDGTRQVVQAWLNQVNFLGSATWQVEPVIEVDQKDMVTTEFSLHTDNISTPIEVLKWELRTSVVLSLAMQGAVNNQLPAIMYFANSSQVLVAQSPVIAISGSLQTSGSTNLLLHLLITGTASVDALLTLSFLMNNKEAPYSPVKVPVKAGDFYVGIPASMLQVPGGNNQFQIIALSSAGTLTIAKDKFYCTLDGKNIVGGYASEVPHAEVVSYVGYVNVYDNRLVDDSCIVTLTQDVMPIGTLAVNRPATPIGDGKVSCLAQALLTRVAYDEEFKDADYTHDSYVVLDGDMKFKSSIIDVPFELVSRNTEGDIYSVSIDNTSVKLYEAATVTLLSSTVSQYLDTLDTSTYNASAFLLVSNGVRTVTNDIGTYTNATAFGSGITFEYVIDESKYATVRSVD